MFSEMDPSVQICRKVMLPSEQKHYTPATTLICATCINSLDDAELKSRPYAAAASTIVVDNNSNDEDLRPTHHFQYSDNDNDHKIHPSNLGSSKQAPKAAMPKVKEYEECKV
jgi:hypothetical protein